MAHLSSFTVPSELVYHALAFADPEDVSAFAQTCRTYRDIVYGPDDQQLWRDLYLAQPLDDPRECINTLGQPQRDRSFNWRAELQNFVAAAKFIKTYAYRSRSEHELVQILQTLIGLALSFPPSHRGPSRNHLWLHSQLQDGFFITFIRSLPEVEHLGLQLHTLIGFTGEDYPRKARVRSRATTYNLAYYRVDTSWGPFRDRDGMTTNWTVLQSIQHLIALHVQESAAELEGEKPPSIFTLQGPEPAPSEVEGDWIGISGSWNGDDNVFFEHDNMSHGTH
jgi:hypothetical protein